ncbi:MAG TPA: hypothetical protein VFM48_05595 [Aquabacterium sp.]|nr:hypothetical protein [Aquabacterium sp.]
MPHTLRGNIVLSIISLAALSSTCHADTRAAWGTSMPKDAVPLDDSALTEVSGRGTLDDKAVKVLQEGGKLSESAQRALQMAGLGSTASESAEKQATQTQYRMAMGVTQTMVNTVQLTGLVTSMAAPVSPAPAMSIPLLGLPMFPR